MARIKRFTQDPFSGYYCELNGIGSDANFWQRMLKSTLGAINPVTTHLFEIAADGHDLAYFQGDVYGLGIPEAQEDADKQFHQTCLFLVEHPELSSLGLFNRSLVHSNRWYFRYKSDQYYWALRKGGHDVYPKKSCIDPTRIWKPGERWTLEELENSNFKYEIV